MYILCIAINPNDRLKQATYWRDSTLTPFLLCGGSDLSKSQYGEKLFQNCPIDINIHIFKNDRINIDIFQKNQYSILMYWTGLGRPRLLVVNISAWQEVEDQRLLWCQLLQVMRQVVANVYINTLFFNFFFRVILIRFADRGLVVEGRPELTLFHQLYWTVFGAFFFMGIFSYPISKIVKGTFPESILGSVCMLRGIERDEDNIRSRLAMLAYICITEFTNQYFSWKVLSWMSDLITLYEMHLCKSQS